ncbi:MAG: endonuclease/exonuclease/phosphatase family protein [Natronospirillum sp.]|uniref:endonuclease/exonuclease/phosphatase family protein n=1 Tax=Natronospirillum sp. TaxID=2812955 RepID=UPI0025D72099|nr:endonuclease/exonuclease/phosphatase family protein [Natronospirillum sp.]MCH8552755.1 endonuclease/exonuclease/phosphatase family protein [Natronospirillum sp.]
MIHQIEVMARRLRRGFSRSLWLSRLLRLSVSKGAPSRPGLIMIQIDGLGYRQLLRALDAGELPFLQRLVNREHYQLHDHYSGLPSSTPAVQAELFYGIRGAVPAFSFRDHKTGQIRRMYESDAAAQIEQGARHDSGDPLLAGGSAYSDNYNGGAAEPHFCPTSMGWGAALRGANPVVVLAFVLTNAWSLVRISALFVLELGLSLLDLVRGIFSGQSAWKEFKFIPTRVGISILLRELCVIGGKLDISRGLPIIHINFLGYDEQSHRRGPEARFAHWALKGIDDAIARLWHASHRAQWRHYDLWVYSDHGQASVTPFHRQQGYSLQSAVNDAWATLSGQDPPTAAPVVAGIETLRVRLLGFQRLSRLFAVKPAIDRAPAAGQWLTTGMGPVGHAYAPGPLHGRQRREMAQRLVHQYGVPVVLIPLRDGAVAAWTVEGAYRLPEDAAALFGEDHPFLDSLGEDMAALCNHPDAGELVLLGWRAGIKSLTFADENGAHAGPSPEETHAFALLPKDAPIANNPAQSTRQYLRPLDLRQAALRLLGRHQEPASDRSIFHPVRTERTRARTLRVMTYNVHSCIGMDGKLDVARIARIIARARPDIVALQELDVGRERSAGMDQARDIARLVAMDVEFHPVVHMEGERYGDAILTHWPLRLIKADVLPGMARHPEREPRGALWVTVSVGNQDIQVITTHLGLNGAERSQQARALLGPGWLGHMDCKGPVIVLGDFNARPSTVAYRLFTGQLHDAQVLAENHRPRGTFSSRFPGLRIDHIFVSDDWSVGAVETAESTLARVASDHLPLLAELTLIEQVGQPRKRSARQHRAGGDKAQTSPVEQ